MSLLDDIAELVGAAIPAAGLTRDATLIKVTDGTSAPGQVSGVGNPTFESFNVQGIVSDYSTYEMTNTLIKAGDRKVKLFAATIAGGAVPEPGDRLIIEGMTLVIVGPIERDAASAVYTCQGRA